MKKISICTEIQREKLLKSDYSSEKIRTSNVRFYENGFLNPIVNAVFELITKDSLNDVDFEAEDNEMLPINEKNENINKYYNLERR